MSKALPPIIFDPEYLIVARNANQSITSGVWTKVLFDTTIAQNGLTYDSSAFQVIIPFSALWTISFSPRFASSSTGATHGARILLNTTVHQVLLIPNIFISNTDAAIPLNKTYFYQGGDSLQFECFQGSGVAKNLSVAGDLRSYLTIIRASNS